MNRTALKAALSSDNFRMRLHGALVSTAKVGYSVCHVDNRKGEPVLAVRYRKVKGQKRGFTIVDGSGTDRTKEVFKLLRAGI